MHSNEIVQGYGIIVFDWFPFDLQTLLENKKLTEQQRVNIFRLLCKAVKECHKNGLVHLNIRPESILVSGDYSTIKLCDFEFTQPAVGKAALTTSNHSTLIYSAPELFNPEPFHGNKADIWSLGMLFHVLVTGYWPYEITEDDNEVLLRIKNGLFSNRIYDPSSLILMNKMTAKNPAKRIDIFSLCLYTHKLYSHLPDCLILLACQLCKK